VAQSNVYSLNVVGYYNITIPGNKLALIANQFNTTNNTLGALIPAPPVNTIFYKWTTGSGYTLYQFAEFDLVWYPDSLATLNPGEGGLMRNPGGTDMTLTFVGEVPQGALANPIPNGYSIRSSQVPQAGDINSLGFPAVPNDIVYKWFPASGYTLYQFDEFDLVWYPSVPVVSVGESLFVSKVGAATWTRNFTVQ